MFAICLESSHQKGMGHLFRAINFFTFLKSNNEQCLVVLNDDPIAIDILTSKGIHFEIVDLTDYISGWEAQLINKYSVDVWINDRLDTDYRHSENVKKCGIKLITFDDHGEGAVLSDMHVAALNFYEEIKINNKKMLRGIDYLILNKDIAKFKRLRKGIHKVLVTLGGSDTYGVTVKVVSILKEIGISADIHLGPSFKHNVSLESLVDNQFTLIGKVPSLIELFYGYDLAITGGGITPFEANATGLPCIVVANELFEIANGKFLSELGSSIFAGYHEEIDNNVFNQAIDAEKMSLVGINKIPLDGAENIYRQIQLL
jgi:spore coat polysaccharide biosynthesis predicted glycosyltransferase SpsG